MSATRTPRLVALTLAAALAVAAGAASAQTVQTLGESLASGQISPAAFDQLIAGTGLTAVEARGLTLSDIALMKTDSN